jgi:hypothetical protein
VISFQRETKAYRTDFCLSFDSSITKKSKVFFSKSNDATEMDEAIYLPTPRIEEFAEIFRDYHDGDIGNVESYGPRR